MEYGIEGAALVAVGTGTRVGWLVWLALWGASVRLGQDGTTERGRRRGWGGSKRQCRKPRARRVGDAIVRAAAVAAVAAVLAVPAAAASGK